MNEIMNVAWAGSAKDFGRVGWCLDDLQGLV